MDFLEAGSAGGRVVTNSYGLRLWRKTSGPLSEKEGEKR